MQGYEDMNLEIQRVQLLLKLFKGFIKFLNKFQYLQQENNVHFEIEGYCQRQFQLYFAFKPNLNYVPFSLTEIVVTDSVLKVIFSSKAMFQRMKKIEDMFCLRSKYIWIYLYKCSVHS